MKNLLSVNKCSASWIIFGEPTFWTSKQKSRSATKASELSVVGDKSSGSVVRVFKIVEIFTTRNYCVLWQFIVLARCKSSLCFLGALFRFSLDICLKFKFCATFRAMNKYRAGNSNITSFSRFFVSFPNIWLFHPETYKNCIWCKNDRFSPINRKCIARRSY